MFRQQVLCPWGLALLALALPVQASDQPEPQADQLGQHRISMGLAVLPPAETLQIHLARRSVSLQPTAMQRLVASEGGRGPQGADLFQLNLDQAPGQVEVLPFVTKGILPFLRCNTRTDLVTCLQTPLALQTL
jgi:hypothetical protein